MRGEDRYLHFELIDPPAAERDASALTAYRQASERNRENHKVQFARHEERYATRRPVPASLTVS